MNYDELEIAQTLAERGEYDRAYILANKHLKQDPEDYTWLMVMSYIMLGTDKPILAYHLAKRCTQIQPKNPGGFMNLGMACKDLRLDDAALRYNRRGLKLSKSPDQRQMLHVNASSVLVDTGQYQEAEEHCLKALEIKPDSEKAIANLGFCQLAQRNWKEGWKNYRSCLGHEWRPIHKYDDEPLWDGKSKGTIAIYGEQGLGDQISFASMIPDLLSWAKDNDSRIVFDASNRLENLLKRSFPDATIYGTQGKQELYWAKEDQKIDYSLPIGQVAEYFRTKDSDFPGVPYLKPDEDRVIQWKALFDSKFNRPSACPKCDGYDLARQNDVDWNCQSCHYVWHPGKKPVIGIAWSGGIPHMNSSAGQIFHRRFRGCAVSSFAPLLPC